jgi:small-conductance mechanosensitive channel
MQPFFERWAGHIVDGIPNLLTAILIFVVALYLARLVAELLRAFLQRRGVHSHVVDMLARFLYWTILMIGVVIALQRFFDVTAFLAGLGIIDFTVGFALQDVMKNLRRASSCCSSSPSASVKPSAWRASKAPSLPSISARRR